MGFYLDLIPAQSRPNEFREVPPPAYFWALYSISVFALGCMALAAYQVLGGLAQEESLIDKFLVGSFLFAFAFLGLTGLKFVGVRKFVKLEKDSLVYGYLFFGTPLIGQRLFKKDISSIGLVNKRPAPNRAPDLHEDSQYYVRGHWRVVVALVGGREKVLDKHVEKEALVPLVEFLESWFTDQGVI